MGAQPIAIRVSDLGLRRGRRHAQHQVGIGLVVHHRCYLREAARSEMVRWLPAPPGATAVRRSLWHRRRWVRRVRLAKATTRRARVHLELPLRVAVRARDAFEHRSRAAGTRSESWW